MIILSIPVEWRKAECYASQSELAEIPERKIKIKNGLI